LLGLFLQVDAILSPNQQHQKHEGRFHVITVKNLSIYNTV